MKLQQLQYVIEIDRTKSISRAAEQLYLTQPNLSNAVSELEKELGIKIFSRTNRGVITTEEGEEFISYARSIINQMYNLEQMYSTNKQNTTILRYAWSVGSANTIRNFVNLLPSDIPVNIHLIEGNHLEVIKSLQQRDADIGTIYIPEHHVEEYERYARNHKLIFKKLWKMKSVVLVSADSELASKKIIETEDLSDNKYIQMIYQPSGILDRPNSIAPKERVIRVGDRNIYYNDRATLLEIVSSCPNAYAQTIPAECSLFKKYNIVAIPQNLNDLYFVKIVLYHKHRQNKELKWLLDYLEELKNPSHPDWTDAIKPIPIDK